MATISTRINSSGTYLVNGSFDEITYNRTSPVIKNLLIYTDSFDNVNWGKGSVSITANSTTAPDGTIVADTIVENTTPSSYHFINQSFNKTATANTYTYSIYAKDAGRSGLGLRIDNNAGSGAVVTYNVATGATILGAGTYGSFTGASSNILSVGNGWYRISLTATTDASTTVAFVQNYLHSIPAGTTVYTGDGISGIYIWGAQIEQNSTTTIYQGIAAASTLVTPTFKNKVTSDAVYVTDIFDEVTYNTSSGVVKNLLSWSEYFKAWEVGDQSGWFYNLTPNQVTFDVIAGPAPNTLAGKLIDIPAALGSQIHRIYTNSAPFTSGVTYTLSIYAKAAERTKFMMFHEETLGRVGIDVDLDAVTATASNGSPTNIFINSAGNGWYRAGFTFTATQTGNTVVTIVRMRNAASAATYIGDGSSGLYVWGVQLEESSSATLYQGNGIRTSTVFGTKSTPLSPGFAKRDDASGNTYVADKFDEFTGAPVVDSSLKVWLDAGQTTSYLGTGTTWTDLSSTGNSPILTNSPTFNTTLGGGAITFNGSTNYALKTTPTGIPSGANSFTLSAWFYPTSSATTMRVVSYGAENTGQLVSIRLNAGGAYVVGFAHWGGAGYDVGNGSTAIPNTWNNVVEVFDGTNDYMYINGTLVGTFTPSTLSIPANSDFYVGRRITGESFAGSVGQVMLYNRALTADEVTQNFNALRRRYGI